jgi:hypothetical protein
MLLPFTGERGVVTQEATQIKDKETASLLQQPGLRHTQSLHQVLRATPQTGKNTYNFERREKQPVSGEASHLRLGA